MALRPIVLYPNPVLKTPAHPVTAFDGALRSLIDDMAETMYHAKGVGLAANQVNVLQRVAVIDVADEGQPAQLLELVNPRITRFDGKARGQEGCLSLPKLYDNVDRATHVTVVFESATGETRELAADGLLAICLQHEIDHLDGIVFLDRMGPLARSLAMKRYRKLLDQRLAQAQSQALGAQARPRVG
jgi:peptide deformylase